MSRYLSLVLCLVCAPAFADLNITEDTTLSFFPDQYTVVHGDATLTVVAGPNGEIPTTFRIELLDDASLVMESGDVRELWLSTPKSPCPNEIMCPTFHRASISNSHVNSILIDSAVLSDVSLHDTTFSSIRPRNLSTISISYSESFAPSVRGAIGGSNFGHLSFSAPGADYIQEFQNERFQFLFTNPDGVQESPAFLAIDDFHWMLDSGRISITPTDQFVSGDADGSGTVDIADMNLVRNNFGRVLARGMDSSGDTAPYDGVVGITDLNRVRNNFGASLTQPVPEPPTAVLVFTFLATMFLLRSKSPIRA